MDDLPGIRFDYIRSRWMLTMPRLNKQTIVITYLVVAVLTYGIIGSDRDRWMAADHPGYTNDDAAFAATVPPLFYGAVWPVYWPLHLARKLF